MSGEGKKLLSFIKQARRVLVDISLLLRTVDDIMVRNGWRPYPAGVRESSSDIKSPEKWLPWTVYRFYTNDDRTNILAFVSILLDNEVDQQYAIPEPLVSAGLLNYGNKKVGDNFEYWYSQLYGYASDRSGSGEIIELSAEGNWREKLRKYGLDKAPFESAKFSGLPLASIRNSMDVESKIIAPLLRLLVAGR